MTRKTDYTNEAQQRILKVVLVLFNDVVIGLSNSQIARAVACSPAVTTRDLDNLRTAGLAVRDEETGLWRLTPRLPQHTRKAWDSMDRAEQRVAEMRQRMSRDPS